ncbi:hypothetical protein BMAA1316 [Burkholderia mallei ATCC 23344]|uniref:Uncharacterized protein n=1 Tax=Burkholderia mallei (strain ATCC 23344) TaxID=243160 RepID=A0A0H2XDK1_BURMA|nr:hypothetical protein BMAA1316 [Burkholderia mallei ATCC 23344]
MTNRIKLPRLTTSTSPKFYYGYLNSRRRSDRCEARQGDLASSASVDHRSVCGHARAKAWLRQDGRRNQAGAKGIFRIPAGDRRGALDVPIPHRLTRPETEADRAQLSAIDRLATGLARSRPKMRTRPARHAFKRTDAAGPIDP